MDFLKLFWYPSNHFSGPLYYTLGIMLFGLGEKEITSYQCWGCMLLGKRQEQMLMRGWEKGVLSPENLWFAYLKAFYNLPYTAMCFRKLIYINYLTDFSRPHHLVVYTQEKVIGKRSECWRSVIFGYLFCWIP